MSQSEEKDMRTEVQRMIDTNAVVVMATSTCPFCVEAKRTLAAHGVTGLFVDMDKESNTSDMRKAMTALSANRTSVPQIWIGQKHIGGCDDLKALESTGDLGLQLKGLPRGVGPAGVEGGGETFEKTGGVSADAAVVTYPGPTAAYFSMFHAATSVDNRAVRLGGAMTFFIAVACAVFARRYVTEWVVLGLFVDFCLRMAGLPTPFSMLANLPFAGTKPKLSAGPSRQFANLCGVFFAGVAWACLVGDKPIGAQIMLAILAMAAFLQGFLNFCAGCVVFGYLMKFGLVSEAVFRMHVNSRADTIFTWEKNNIRTGKNFSPEAVTYPTQGLPSNPTDLRAKPAKEDDKWERFHVVKYCHMSYFMMPLSILGLALPWATLSDSVGTARWVFQVLAWVGVCMQVVLGGLFLAKCTLYPSKVKKEWCHPTKHNSFAVPFLCFIIMSWLATKWTGEAFSGDLAKVLYWMGTAPLSCMTLFTIGSWITFPCDEEFVNPTWMLMPVGNLVGALAARPVSEDYLEWGWFMFGTGVLLWLALWPITFRKSILDHHSDFRLRSLYGVWVAPPAVMMLAYSSLEQLTSLDATQRLLFYASLAMALVLAPCVWPLNFFLEGKFDMSWWAFAFPLDALAAAAVAVYNFTLYDTMQVIYVVALTAACLVNGVNILATLASLKARKIFTPDGKWSPLSFMKLTHEAFREAIPKMEKLAAAAKPGVADASTLRELASAWTSMAVAHDVHSKHEDDVIFPALEALFPGTTRSVAEEHEEHEKLMASVQSAVDSLLGGKGGSDDDADRLALLDKLKADLTQFGKDVLEHLDHEELYYATPVARKYLSIKTAKELARKSWEATGDKEMSQLLGWVMGTLRMRGQRTRFLKAWIWAMPERAQQIGLMVYRVVDDVTWVEVARDLPEAIPRGLPGYRRRF
eukprot:g15119.t1